MKNAVVAVTESGAAWGAVIARALPDCAFFRPPAGEMPELAARLFREYRGIVFVCAAGIAVRMIAPLVASKHEDPAVVAMDDAGRAVVSLLSGHEGGANRLAYDVAAATGAEPVVTTASEANKTVTLGIGCRRGVSADQVETAVRTVLDAHGVDLAEVRAACTTARKRDEEGLREACRRLDLPLLFFPDWKIRRLRDGFAPSSAAKRNLDLPGVSEPCALLGGRDSRLLGPRLACGPVTAALARESVPAGPEGGFSAGPETSEAAAASPERPRGRLTVVGIGPGNSDLLAPKARRAIREAHLVVGYTRYLRLLGGILEGKETFSTGMRREEERAGRAVAEARAGGRVVLVSSGDAGVYGLAGLALETLSGEDLREIDFEVIPGITAASSCAALLGAPLSHDFAVISLSDLLTRRELIEKRVRLAAEGDFVIALYNPRSSKRRDLLEWTRDRLLETRGPDVPVGLVRDAGRPEEWVRVTNLGELPELYGEIDMGTTVIIGNSRSYRKGRFIVTPRGYGERLTNAPHSAYPEGEGE